MVMAMGLKPNAKDAKVARRPRRKSDYDSLIWTLIWTRGEGRLGGADAAEREARRARPSGEMRFGVHAGCETRLTSVRLIVSKAARRF